MTERFEAETPFATRAGVELAGILGVAMALFVSLLAGLDPRWTPLLVVAGTGPWLAARWLLLGVRYEVARGGLAVQRGPFRSGHEWASLVGVAEGIDPLSGCPGLVVRRRDGEHLCVRPRDREAFVAALLRHVGDIDLGSALDTDPGEPIEAAA